MRCRAAYITMYAGSTTVPTNFTGQPVASGGKWASQTGNRQQWMTGHGKCQFFPGSAVPALPWLQ